MLTLWSWDKTGYVVGVVGVVSVTGVDSVTGADAGVVAGFGDAVVTGAGLAVSVCPVVVASVVANLVLGLCEVFAGMTVVPVAGVSSTVVAA